MLLQSYSAISHILPLSFSICRVALQAAIEERNFAISQLEQIVLCRPSYDTLIRGHQCAWACEQFLAGHNDQIILRRRRVKTRTSEMESAGQRVYTIHAWLTLRIPRIYHGSSIR